MEEVFSVKGIKHILHAKHFVTWPPVVKSLGMADPTQFLNPQQYTLPKGQKVLNCEQPKLELGKLPNTLQ